MVVKFKVPPTRSEIQMGRVAVKAARILGEEPDAVSKAIAEFPPAQASPESMWPTLPDSLYD